MIIIRGMREIFENQRGITLMEVIILVIVSSLFILSVLPLITDNIVQNASSKTRLQAYEAAQQELETLRNSAFDSLASGTFSVPSSIPGGRGTVTITNDINGDGNAEVNIVKARADVSFTEKNQIETVSLTTLIAK